jgi:hypothetical protein
MLHRLIESEAEFLQQLSPEVRERVLSGDIPVIRQARPEPPAPQPRLPPGAALAIIPELLLPVGGRARAPITVGRRVGPFLRRIEIAANPRVPSILRQRIQRQVEHETPQFLENIKPVIQRDPGFLFEVFHRLSTARESLTGPLARQVDRILSAIRSMVVEITPQETVRVSAPDPQAMAEIHQRAAEAAQARQPIGQRLTKAVRSVAQMISGRPTRPRDEETIETMMQDSLRSFGQVYHLATTTPAEMRTIAEASRLLGRALTADDVRTYFPPPFLGALRQGVARSLVQDNPERGELLAHAAAYAAIRLGGRPQLSSATLRLVVDRPHLFPNRDSVEAFVDAARGTMDSLIRSGVSARDAEAMLLENIHWVSRRGASGETP